MRIQLNKRYEEFTKEPVSVDEMLLIKRFSYKMRIVKINGVLVPKEKYGTTLIYDGDEVQMLYLMSGG